ncbi:hypothetical protein D3C85_1820960 [compost metagenome]
MSEPKVASVLVPGVPGMKPVMRSSTSTSSLSLTWSLLVPSFQMASGCLTTVPSLPLASSSR